MQHLVAIAGNLRCDHPEGEKGWERTLTQGMISGGVQVSRVQSRHSQNSGYSETGILQR